MRKSLIISILILESPISPTSPIHPIKPNVPCVAVPQQHKSHRAQAISLTLRSVGGLYGRQQSSYPTKSQLGNSNMRCKYFLSHWSLTISFWNWEQSLHICQFWIGHQGLQLIHLSHYSCCFGNTSHRIAQTKICIWAGLPWRTENSNLPNLKDFLIPSFPSDKPLFVRQ